MSHGEDVADFFSVAVNALDMGHFPRFSIPLFDSVPAPYVGVSYLNAKGKVGEKTVEAVEELPVTSEV